MRLCTDRGTGWIWHIPSVAVADFLIYLRYSDGSVNKEEIKYINLLFGTQFDEKMIRDYADRWGLRSESIRDHAPRSLNSFVRSNIGAEIGEVSDGYYDLITDCMLQPLIILEMI